MELGQFVRSFPAWIVALFLATVTSPAAEPTGDLYVLSIGVEPQLTAKGKNDPYARDAGHMAEAFSAAKPLYRKVHSQVVNGAGATHAAVVEHLANLVKAQRAQDLAVVFFSTHGGWGAKEGYSISLARDGRQERDLKDAEFLRILGRARGRVIVLLDTCCAAGVLPRDKSALPNVSFLVACRRDEGSSGSGPSKTKPHGCFVVASVEALQGRADADRDGTVTLGELEGYVPNRARELYNEQNAVSRISLESAKLALVKVDPQSKPVVPEKIVGARNPFGMPDINRPFGKDVKEFSQQTRIAGGDSDDNAATWAGIAVPKKDGIDGRWSSRWKSEGADWSTGSAIIKTVEDRVFIMYHDGGSRYLIEARRNGPQRLVGRYVNVSDEDDSNPWVGKIIGNDRIDGVWPSGRWDFRRTWRDGAE